MGGGGGGIAIIVTSSRLQVTLRVETCDEFELSLPESDLEPSLLKSDNMGATHKITTQLYDTTSPNSITRTILITIFFIFYLSDF